MFGSLLATVVNTVTLPVDIVKDVVTLGGTLTEEESAVKEKLNKMVEDIKEIEKKV